jgi:hypothetical protein
MPRHCRVAKLLVEADVKMKQVAQGRAKLAIRSPFPGDFDLLVKDWHAQIAAGHEPNIPASITRYWFTPGRFSYGLATDTDNVARFAYAQVVLKTEDEKITSERERVATGRIDPYAQAFTCAWTARMEDTYKAEPLWQEMRNMYRHFALARIMYDLDAFDQAEFDRVFLLEVYELPKVMVPDTAPGGSRVEIATQRRGGTTWTYSRSVCGGVDVGFNTPLEKFPDTDRKVQRAGQSVLGSRPASTVLAWNVTPGAVKAITPSIPASMPSSPPPTPSAEPSKPSSLGDLFKSRPSAPDTPPTLGKTPSLQDLFKR